MRWLGEGRDSTLPEPVCGLGLGLGQGEREEDCVCLCWGLKEKQSALASVGLDKKPHSTKIAEQDTSFIRYTPESICFDNFSFPTL